MKVYSLIKGYWVLWVRELQAHHTTSRAFAWALQARMGKQARMAVVGSRGDYGNTASKGEGQFHRATAIGVGPVASRLLCPKGPWTQIVYTLAPKYLCRDYLKAKVYIYLGTWTLRG